MNSVYIVIGVLVLMDLALFYFFCQAYKEINKRDATINGLLIEMERLSMINADQKVMIDEYSDRALGWQKSSETQREMIDFFRKHLNAYYRFKHPEAGSNPAMKMWDDHCENRKIIETHFKKTSN